jgi:hypothetical protein
MAQSAVCTLGPRFLLRYHIPSVFVPLACTSGCTVGPGAEGAEGALVVVFVGALVGYLRAAEPAALAVFEAVEPICRDW